MAITKARGSSLQSETISLYDFLSDQKKAAIRARSLVDVTTELRDALNKIALTKTASSSYGSGAGSGSSPTLILPAGKLKITADVSPGFDLNYIKIKGNRTIFEVDPGVTFLSGIRYMFDMEGVTIRGGAIALSISTGNVDTTLITVKDCEFHQQTNCVFNVAANSNSTQLLVQNSKIVINSNTTGKVLKALSGDSIKFIDCWVTICTATEAAFDITDCSLSILRMLGVPNFLFAWVDMKGLSSFYSDAGCRFGGESGGTTNAVVINRVSADTSYPVNPSVISMQGSNVYSGGPLLRCYAIPNVVNIVGVTGLVDTKPIKIESTVPAADLAAIGGLNHQFKVEFNSTDYGPLIDHVGASVIAREGLPLANDRILSSARPNVADLILQSQGSTGAYGATSSGSNVTTSTVTDELGVLTLQWVATADSNNVSRGYPTALNGFTSGVYTVVFDFEVLTDHSVRPIFTASNSKSLRHVLARGKHNIAVPLYYDGGAVKSISIEIYNMPNGATVRWSRFRVYAGRRVVFSKRAELEGSAAPAAGQWYVGDIVYNTAPASAGYMGWVCTVAGTPGTWKTWGLIS